MEGVTLPRAAMVQAAKQVQAHGLTQAFNLGLIPLVTWTLVTWLQRQRVLTPLVRDGFLAMACIPSTTSMCVMLSARSGGNAPLAAFNAILSNTVAVIYTPYILGLVTVIDAGVDLQGLAVGLCFKMILPQIAGQVVRGKLGAANVMKNMPKIGKLNQALILARPYVVPAMPLADLVLCATPVLGNSRCWPSIRPPSSLPDGRCVTGCGCRCSCSKSCPTSSSKGVPWTCLPSHEYFSSSSSCTTVSLPWPGQSAATQVLDGSATL